MIIDIKDFRARYKSLTETELLESFFHFNKLGEDADAELAAQELEKRGVVLTEDDYPDNSDLLVGE